MYEKIHMFNKLSLINIYRSTMLVLLVLVLTFLPSTAMLTDFYYVFTTFGLIIFIILCILATKTSSKIKLTLCLLVIGLYRTNVKIMSEILLKMLVLSYTNPIDVRKDDSMVRDLVNSVFRSNFNLKTEFAKLPSCPSILVCNYCKDRIENVACVLFPVDLAIMMRDGLKKTMHFHKVVKWPIFTKSKGNYEDTKAQVEQHIKAGRSVFTYITKHPKIRPDIISNVRSGTFSIAKELNVPITLVCIDYVDTHFGSIKKQNFRICVGDTFMVEDVSSSMYRSKTFFKETMKEFIRRKYECIF